MPTRPNIAAPRPQTLALALAFCGFTLSAIGEEEPVSRIAFGSCCKQSRRIPIFEAIDRYEPEVWIWMGDNIYGDSEEIAVLEKKWAVLKGHPGYRTLRGHCQIIGTWDDHDFGRNDAGKEFPIKAASQQAFLDFLDVAKDDPRRKREGVYASHTFGPVGKRVKVILLDTRYHRDAPGPKGDVLGEAQWKWLEGELVGSEAQVHLLVSSIQVIAPDHRFEKWGNFPKALARLHTLLAREDVPPVTLLSGDRHHAEISGEPKAAGYPLYDVTSSSMNVPISRNRDEKNSKRVVEQFGGANFGTLDIDWASSPPALHFAIRDEEGEVMRELRDVRQER